MYTVLASLVFVVFTSKCLAQSQAGPGQPKSSSETSSDASNTRGDSRLTPASSNGPSAAAVAYRRSFAVIVGINAYPVGREGLPPLEFAVNDARELRDLLRDEFGYANDRIKYLTDADATLTNLRGALYDWPRKMGIGADDALVFFYAGHGLVDEATNEGFLAAVDSDAGKLQETCLPVEWIREQLSALPCRHKLVLLDSCYSGSLFRRPTASLNDLASVSAVSPAATSERAKAGAVATRGTGATPLFADNIAYYLRQPAFLGISAGRFTPVADGSGEQRHSIFTASLLQVLRERADSPRDDHIFTFRQVAAQVETLVANAAQSKQIPDWGRLGDGDGDFIFRPTKRRQTPREVSAARAALTKRRAYTAAIRAGFKAADEKNMPLLAEQIQNAQRALDGPADFSLRHLQRRFQDPRFAGSLGVDGIRACSFSPSGRRLAAFADNGPSAPGILKIWQIADGKLQKPREETIVRPVRKLRFVDDERLLLIDEQTIELRGVDAQKSLGRWSSELPILQAEVVGETLIAGGMRALTVVDVATMKARHTLVGHLGYVKHLAPSPDGRLLASAGSDGRILLWDLEKGEQIRGEHWSERFLTGGATDGPRDADRRIGMAFPQSIAAMIDSGSSRTAGTDLSMLRFVDDDTLVVKPRFASRHEMWHLPSGTKSRRSTANDFDLVPTDVHAYSKEFVFQQQSDFVTAVHLGTGEELRASRLNLFRPQSAGAEPAEAVSARRGNWLNDLAVSSDGRFVVAATADGYLYDLTRKPPPTRVFSDVPEAGALAVSPTADLAACGGVGGEVVLFRPSDGAVAGKLVGHNGYVASACFTPDGKTLATRSIIGLIGEVIVWDLARRVEVFRVPDVSFLASPPSISPDGRLLTVVRDILGRRATLVYDLTTRGLLRELPACTRTIFAPNGNLLLIDDVRYEAVCLDGRFEATDVLEVAPLCFSRDGKSVAVFGGESGTAAIELRSWPELEIRATLRPDDDERFESVATFSGDGRLLATLRGFENGLELWDVATGERLRQWTKPYNLRNLAFTLGDECLLFASLDQGVAVERALHEATPIAERDPIDSLTERLKSSANDGRLWMQRGVLYAQRGDYELAARDYDVALSVSKGAPEDYLRLVEFYRKFGNTSSALAAIARYPQWSDHAELRRLRIQLLFDSEQYAAAERELKLLIARLPTNAELLVRHAEALANIGGAGDALVQLEKAAKLDDQAPRLLVVRAFTKQRSNDVDGALADCENALKNDPEDVEALWIRAKCRASRKEAELMFADATRVLSAKPDHAEARHLVGLYWFEQGKLRKALDELEAALRIRPALHAARFSKGLVLQGLSEYAAAEKEFTTLVALDAENSLCWLHRGRARLEQAGREAEARADFDQALKLNSKLVLALYGRGEALRRTGKLDLALADLNRAVELAPDQAGYLLARGKTYFEKQDFTAAERDLGKVFQKFPNDRDVVWYAARTLARIGRYETALKQFDRLLDAFPEDVAILRETAWWLATVDDESLRKPSRAVELALRACELTARQDWESLTSLSAARAAGGDFGTALADLTEAERLATAEERKRLQDYASLLVERKPIVEPKPLPRLIEDVRHTEVKVAAAALQKLGGLGDEALPAIPTLIAALDDVKYPVRHSVAYALGRLGPTAAPAEIGLRRHVNDPDSVVRSFVAWALLKISPKETEAVFTLIDQLRAEERLTLNLELLAGAGNRAKPALPLLKKLAAHEEPEVRILTCNVIGILGAEGAAAAEELRDRLDDADESVRFVAARALRAVGADGPEVRASLRSLLAAKSGQVRISAATLCRDDAELAKYCREQILALLADQFFDVRVTAADTVGKHLRDYTPAIAALTKAVEQSNRIEARAAAGQALAQIGETALPAFSELLKNPNGDVRLVAAGMLGNLKERAATFTDELTTLALDGSQPPRVREACLATIGHIGKPAARTVDRILPLLESSEEGLRMRAAQAVSGIATFDNPGLAKLLRHPQDKIRQTASYVLLRMGSEARRPLLDIVADKSADRELRMWAAVQVGLFPDDPTDMLLETCSRGDEGTVEVAAACVANFAKDKQVDVIPQLVAAFDAPQPAVRHCAARILFQLDAPLDRVLPSLLRLLADEDELLRSYAVITLEKHGESALPVLMKRQESASDPSEREAIGRALAAVHGKLQSDATTKRFEN
jgi:tetratricopeptide (TPR) repeat protein